MKNRKTMQVKIDWDTGTVLNEYLNSAAEGAQRPPSAAEKRTYKTQRCGEGRGNRANFFVPIL